MRVLPSKAGLSQNATGESHAANIPSCLELLASTSPFGAPGRPGPDGPGARLARRPWGHRAGDRAGLSPDRTDGLSLCPDMKISRGKDGNGASGPLAYRFVPSGITGSRHSRSFRGGKGTALDPNLSLRFYLNTEQ